MVKEMRRIYTLIIIACSLLLSMSALAADDHILFYNLTNRDGLSNSQVNYIYKDNRGYVWLGTQSGLNRFDGFRFKTFFYGSLNDGSLPNNQTSTIQQDAWGNLWIHTAVGYCRYLYEEEQFDRKPEKWISEYGIDGQPEKMFIDSKKNMWLTYTGKGCFFISPKEKGAYCFPAVHNQTTNAIPEGVICDMKEDTHGNVVLAYRDGTLVKVNGPKKQVLWTKPDLKMMDDYDVENTYFSIDHLDNIWVYGNEHPYIYSAKERKWYLSAEAFLASKGIQGDTHLRRVRYVVNDLQKRLWITTDHHGLFIIDFQKHTAHQYLAGTDGHSLPDNALTRLFVDNTGGVWIGTYKNGLVYSSSTATRFSTLDLGDICTIAEDKAGNLWMGANDEGIRVYNPRTGQSKIIDHAATGLKSKVIVSSLAASDGALYFGTFNGGMTCLRGGKWTAYQATGAPDGLANNNVWSMVEDRNHNIWIATLGNGLQMLNPKTGKFTTYNTANSGLCEDYLSSVSLTPEGNILIGHTQNFSIMDIKTHRVTNYSKTRDGKEFPTPTVNQIKMDSRGLIWSATPSGIYMYDPKTSQLANLSEIAGKQGSVGCSVVEGRDHSIWLVSEFAMSHVRVFKNEKGLWDFTLTSYDALDGLQEGQFNQRSILLTRNGNIVLGGQKGVNIINPSFEKSSRKDITARFSGLVLFDHPLTVGEEWGGSVVLKKSLDVSRELSLAHDINTFTIQLSASEVNVPARSRFLYRMEGVNNKWMMTAEGRPFVTFTNLSPGDYKLQVKVVNGDGSENEQISELHITIAPPFYFSWWAECIYALLVLLGIFLWRRRFVERQRIAYERSRTMEAIRKTKELNELKLNFFTNISHELRTPLTLIISPISQLLKIEEDENKKKKLDLIYRNSLRLLNLVNQILDFRKADQNKSKLSLSTVDIVSFVDSICTSFRALGNQKIHLDFYSRVPMLKMAFDVDKVGKIVNNLLSNAYKFTPDGGKVSVEITVLAKDEQKNAENDIVKISVADTGKGISDKEKKQVFERFYQVNGTEMQPFGGSGLGLSLVWEFVQLHGGDVHIEDNPGGGTIFIVNLPVRQEPQAEESSQLTDAAATVAPYVTTPVEQLQAKHETDDSQLTDGDKPEILLVDDSDDFRAFMAELLSDHYRVVEAINGQEAWAKIQDHHPDMILSDVMMPVMDGNQLCRLVKGNAETASIPLIMLTARMAEEHQKEGYENGANAYITKPFDVDLLIARINNLLKWAAPNSDELTEEEEEIEDEQYVLTESDKKFLAQVDAYIEENLGNSEASVEAMSDALLISRVQLYKRMVSLTGTTPSEYLRAKRIKRSEELLHSPEYNISEIAYKVGFNNPRYFSKYFQEAYGMTPSQYKKKLTE